MKKNIQKIIFFFSILMLAMIGFTENINAASPPRHKLDLTVHTVIDNIEEVPESKRNEKFYYKAERITMMAPNRRDWAEAPEVMVPNSFSWKHGQTQTLSYGEAKTYINTIWFTPRSRTDSHLSLESVELNDNLRRYTYDDDGFAHYPVSPYDWVEVIDDAKETAELTLHFRYNPDIDGIEVEKPEINPSYSKKIDFLGDNTNNPGAAIEENNYRLHLDMHSGEDWRIKEDKEKDIIFLLDISGSMTTKFGDGTRIKALRETMRQAVNSLTENENNMISIIVFDRSSNELIRGSNNKDLL